MEIGLVRRIDIDDEMQQSYLDYAMSVIVARALPDARDGLKPVHRRVLYAMYAMGIRSDGEFKKSARIVGEVLGKFHPHGDMAVYDAMARMAQDFSMRYTLVDGQGNFGSMDGDSPAAMRYTEAKIAPLGSEMLTDIEKETVAFQHRRHGHKLVAFGTQLCGNQRDCFCRMGRRKMHDHDSPIVGMANDVSGDRRCRATRPVARIHIP